MVELLDQLVVGIQGLITHIQILLGGVFGLYLIYVIGHLFFIRKQYKILKQINRHLVELKEATLKKSAAKSKRRKR